MERNHRPRPDRPDWRYDYNPDQGYQNYEDYCHDNWWDAKSPEEFYFKDGNLPPPLFPPLSHGSVWPMILGLLTPLIVITLIILLCRLIKWVT